ncbi:TPA: DUF1642 domain-containing protein [Listeria monocytogenes]|nr:DUF1642 domain-containing protein [Listeria monocytogenes]
MNFKVGDRVEFIYRNKKSVGEINGVFPETQVLSIKQSDSPIDLLFSDKAVAKVEEAERVVVPRFADDWIKHCKQREYDLACLLDYEDSDMSAEMNDWLCLEESNQGLLVRAWMDGYEVEKEPLYYVMLPYLDAEKEINYAYILVNITDNKTQPSLSNCISREWKAELTEAEIKGMPAGDIYWQFAVLVDEADGEA